MNLSNWRGRAIVVVLLAWCATSRVAWAAAYDESILGDLSDVPAAPTPWTLAAGANQLSGTAGTNALFGTADYDLVALEVPAGHQLDSITIVSYSNPDIFAMSFVGLQAGSPWLDGLGFDIGGYSLMGWAHVQTHMGGMDLLAMIQDHANPPGFSIPLPSGVYTMLIEDVDTMISYALQFNVSAVPEPAGAALALAGALGLGGVRRRQRAS
jgi:MYXO-CTERM domain-containing protein